MGARRSSVDILMKKAEDYLPQKEQQTVKYVVNIEALRKARYDREAYAFATRYAESRMAAM